MSKTIDDFRSFYRTDKERKEFKVKETIRSVIDMQSAQLKDHDINLDISGDEFIYNGLQREFQQVILNLVNNARDALIENNIKNPTIDIKLQNNQITVGDNAGGIPKDIIDRIFEPYFTTKEQGKGTGMGLYFSKMIIEDNMGCSLEVLNKNNGAYFCIDFRRKPIPNNIMPK
jgi:C4-dicarboxylate-specific signal transduction histidine kinase